MLEASKCQAVGILIGSNFTGLRTTYLSLKSLDGYKMKQIWVCENGSYHGEVKIFPNNGVDFDATRVDITFSNCFL